MTTGSRGLHAVVPLNGHHDFDGVHAFAKDVADTLAEEHPGRFATAARKKERGDRFYLDVLRNAYAQTAVVRFTVRARPGRDYLRQRRLRSMAREEIWARAEKFARRLHVILSRFAEDTRLHAPQNAALSRVSGINVLNAAYLVPRAESEEFVELVDCAKNEEPGLRVELTDRAA